AKLARKLGWSTSFAVRAISEYRKFVYLGLTAGFRVTPSKQIDQVWHEHLLFTKAYRDFCTEVLRHDFDHHPELVPVDVQTETFSAQYEATLRLYVDEFNALPPRDIWGTPKFPLEVKRHDSRQPRRVQYADVSGGEGPLYTTFIGDSASSGGAFSEFGGGGGFSGGGGGDSWSGGGHSHGGSDSTSSHSTSSDSTSSDGGSSDGGGSSCSSSCGGGGCGGGD
ncbi:MAG: hypothetical protein ABIW79_09410, partial [Gemmatimonas sp.]